MVNEERIIDALHKLPPSKWENVLQYIESLHESGQVKKRWTARELLRLSREQRDAILAEQAAQMEEEYRTNPELTAFEAFGEKDLYVEHPDSETR
jgi:hypothetical protein